MSKVLHRNLNQVLPMLHRAEKHYFFDAKGTKYLDACGGAAVSCIGHDNAAVKGAIRKQLELAPYAHTSFFTSEPAENLASFLIARAPKGFGKGKVMFLGSGSEAIEAALKLARQFHLENGQPERIEFVSRDGSYHGNTLGALALGGHAQRRKPYQPLLMDVTRIPACYPYRLKRDDESMTAYGQRSAQYLEKVMLNGGPEKVAAFVAEPVSGATLGCVTPAPGYFAKIREICDRHGAIFIADEIMCGMGRTGRLFAIDQENVCPDIIVIAKGLGAGYQPISAVMASEKIVQAIKNGSGRLWNGHTYMCHAVSCAAALAVLREIEHDDLLARVRHQGNHFGERLNHHFGNHPHVGDIRGRGLFWALELVADKSSKKPFSARNQLAAKFKQDLFERGLLSYPAQGCVDGIRGDHILLAPPYTIGEEDLDFIISCLEASFEQLFASFPSTA